MSIVLDEVEWNDEGILQCDGHVDKAEFNAEVKRHNGLLEGDVVECEHVYIRSVGERDGYDEWWELCKETTRGAKPVTQESV